MAEIGAWYEKYGAAFLALLAAALMAFILYSGDGAGLSNNGDYTRIMKTNSLEFVTPLNVPYVYQASFRMNLEGRSPAELLLSPDGTEAYPSVHLAFIRASMGANLASPSGILSTTHSTLGVPSSSRTLRASHTARGSRVTG